MLTASTVSIYAGGQLKPPASTDTSPSGLLSQPPAHLSEYLQSERGLTQLLTHSHTHTLAPNPSRLQFVWFKTKSNGVIYKCPNNHVVCFSSHALIHLISTDSVDIILVDY
jgi:hypothetical protein